MNKCTVCKEEFPQNIFLVMHKETAHKPAQPLRDKCPICLAVFGNWNEYGMFDAKIVPVRTTTRTKGEIVATWETKYKEFII
jgi:hypothetical protein